MNHSIVWIYINWFTNFLLNIYYFHFYINNIILIICFMHRLYISLLLNVFPDLESFAKDTCIFFFNCILPSLYLLTCKIHVFSRCVFALVPIFVLQYFPLFAAWNSFSCMVRKVNMKFLSSFICIKTEIQIFLLSTYNP